MAYNEDLARMIADAFSMQGVVPEEKKMFGGLCYLIGGQMTVGIVKTDLMVRYNAERHSEVMAMPHCRPMDFNGKPMNGFAYVAWEGVMNNPEYLDRFVQLGLDYVNSPEGIAAAAKKAKKASKPKA